MAASLTKLIIGHTAHDKVKVWCRGTQGLTQGRLALTKNGQLINEVNLELNADRAYTNCHTFTVDALEDYQVKFTEGADEVTGAFKTFPEPAEERPFKFMFTSCLLDRFPAFGKKQRIYPSLQRISKQLGTAFTVFCGDQIYVDTSSGSTPKHPVYETYRVKYDDCWGLTGAADFFANNSSYMILDDHELANEFDNANPALAKNKTVGLQVYRDFQHAHNPDTAEDTYYYTFEFGKVKFFVFDLRSERQGDKHRMISKAQEEAFFKWLRDNPDALKVVVTPVPFIIQVAKFIYGQEDKWSGTAFKPAHRALLNELIAKDVRNIFFITGDVHSAVQGRYIAEDVDGHKFEWHEFMAGPLNQIFVNGSQAFPSEKKVAAPGDLLGTYQLNYKRIMIEDAHQNACVMSIDFTDDHYLVQAEWYRAQHKSDVVSINKSEVLKIPRI